MTDNISDSATDTVSEISTESFGSRIMDSIKGVLVGIVLFFASFVVLWWNEGNIVAEKETFKEMAGAVIKTKSSSPTEQNNGKLIHATGLLNSQERIDDDKFLLPGAWLKLKRHVEMFQWTEKKESKTSSNVGGSKTTKTTYRYQREWKAGKTDSSSFKEPKGHENPDLAVDEHTAEVGVAKFGNFDGKPILEYVNTYNPIVLKAEMLRSKSEQFKDRYIYLGKTPPVNVSEPKIGDTRISFETVTAANFSILAQQTELGANKLWGLTPYLSKNGKAKFIVQPGTLEPTNMLHVAEEDSKMFTMIVRVVGFFMMVIGIKLVLQPFATLLDVIPILGSIGSFGTSVIALIVATPLTALTIIVAMIAHNPLLLTLVIVGSIAGIGVWLKRRADKKSTMITAPLAAVPRNPLDKAA